MNTFETRSCVSQAGLELPPCAAEDVLKPLIILPLAQPVGVTGMRSTTAAS